MDHIDRVKTLSLIQSGDYRAAMEMVLGKDAPYDDKSDIVNSAVFASSAGKFDLAARLYGIVVDSLIVPDPPLRLRYGCALTRSGRILDAIACLESLTQDYPQSALAWQALGAAMREADRAEDALDAIENVLVIAPADRLGLLSRAQILTDLGEPALAAYAVAVAVAPDEDASRLGLASAQAATGDFAEAVTTLEHIVTRRPGWVAGWEGLVSLNFRQGGPSAARAAISKAFEAKPLDPAVGTVLLRSLAGIGDHEAVLALMSTVRRKIGDTLPLALIEAQAASETHDFERADRLFTRLVGVDDPVVLLARLRHCLVAKRPEQAVSIGVPLMESGATGIATSYVGTAWRMSGDPRFEWLEADPRLIGVYDLDLDDSQITALAEELRALHTVSHAPFEQSIRGGTQTEGLLLSRRSAAICRLRRALQQAVRRHIDQLPPADLRHPTLGEPREAFRFAGSWSVRLAGGGRHVNHVHSEGWLSSACYIALPGGMTHAASGDDAGWLTFGEPPAELDLCLGPTRIIRPAVGQVVLFPSTMWHGTRPAPPGERLTVAFDVKPLR